MSHDPKVMEEGQELISNPDFEEPFDGDDWYCLGCELTSDTSDAHRGSTSGRVTNRYIYRSLL